MIEIIVPVLYSLIVVIKLKFTPIVSTLTFINRHVFVKIRKSFSGVFKNKPKVNLGHIEDPFTYKKPEKEITKTQKKVDKAGDDISKIIVELGKMFANIDKRVKYLGIGILNIFFLTGAFYHIRWACEHWQITLGLAALLIEWITWINKNKPKEESEKK